MTETHHIEVTFDAGPVLDEVSLVLSVSGTYEPGYKAHTPRGEYAPLEPDEPERFEISYIKEAYDRFLPDWIIKNLDWDEIEELVLMERKHD